MSWVHQRMNENSRGAACCAPMRIKVRGRCFGGVGWFWMGVVLLGSSRTAPTQDTGGFVTLFGLGLPVIWGLGSPNGRLVGAIRESPKEATRTKRLLSG